MVKNHDKYTSKYIPERWASLGFELYDDYDSDVESKSNYGTTFDAF